MSSIVYKIIENKSLPESIANDKDKYIELILPQNTEGVIKLAGIHKTLRDGKIKFQKSLLNEGVHTPILVTKNVHLPLNGFKYERGLLVFTKPKYEEIWQIWERLKTLEANLKENAELINKIKTKVFSEKIF